MKVILGRLVSEISESLSGVASNVLLSRGYFYNDHVKLTEKLV